MAEETNEVKVSVIEPACGLKITSVNVYPFTNRREHPYALALAEVILNDALYIRGLKVMEGEMGRFLAYPPDPYYKAEDYRSAVMPIRKDLREYIEAVVLAHYEFTLKKLGKV